MKTETPTIEKMSKVEAKKYFEDNGVSARIMNEKLQEIIDLSDVGTDREKSNAMIALAQIDKVISAHHDELIIKVNLIKVLKEFSGIKSNKVEEILSDENLFPLLQKIEDDGYKTSFNSYSITIQDEKGMIMVEANGDSFQETIRNGIKEFLIKRGN